MSGLRLTARIWIIRLAFLVGRFMPLQRRVVLATAYFDHLEGNLRTIRRGLARREQRVPVMVLAHRSERGLRGEVRGLFKALSAGFLLATSRVFIVDDFYFPVYAISPRRGTTIIQVWHACGALKKFGRSRGDKESGASLASSGRVRVHGNYDICLASSEATAVCYAEAFGQPLERFVWSLGIPRTDVLFGDRPKVAAQVRLRYGIPSGRTVVLYAPTYRGDEAHGARHPGDLDLLRLQRELGGDHVVLLRLHPLVRPRLGIADDLAGFVVDVSDHADVNELMIASDVLVTDYSSVIFEFALLGRPIALFASDLEAYTGERGVYFDLRTEGPGPIFETTAELAAYLRAARYDTGQLDRFRKKWMTVADGHATDRFIDQLIMPALEGRDPAAPRSQLG